MTVIGVHANQNIDGFSSDVTIESSEWGDGTDIDVNTFSGDVHLRLPASARGNIDFNSFSGRFESDLPVTLSNSSRRNFRGALNGGGNGDFRLKTFSAATSRSVDDNSALEPRITESRISIGLNPNADP